MSSYKSPLVSVILPNYNYAHYLEKTLQSILHQTFKSFEVILIDDGSTDQSLEVIEPFLNRDSRFILLKHEKNKGLFEAVKTGVEAAKGKYLSFLASDDFYLPDFLAKNVETLEKFTTVGLSFSKFATFDSKYPEKLQTIWSPKIDTPTFFSCQSLMTAIKQQKLWIPGHTVVCRKELFISLGGLEEQFFSLSDWFLFHKMAFLHNAYFLPSVLSALRVHEKSYSQTESSIHQQLAWKNILFQLSQKKNRKLKHAFLRSHIFNTLGISFYEYVLKHPKTWWFFKLYTYRHFYKRWKKEKSRQKTL